MRVLIVMFVALFLAGAWVGVRGALAKAELEAALPLASRIQQQIIEGDSKGAAASIREFHDHTSAARALTNDIVWRSGESVPWAGVNLRVVREVIEVVDDFAANGMAPLADLDLDSFRPVNQQIDLEPILDAQPKLALAAESVTLAQDRVRAIDSGGAVPALQDSVDDLQVELDSAASVTTVVARALKLLPTMLGAEGPRTYLILIQNPAELRSGGGIASAMALIRADVGRLTLEQQASSATFPAYADPVLKLPPETRSLYGDITAEYIQNVTLTPQFSLSAQVARAMWVREFGVSVDGVIAVDPIVLSYVLRATGPISIPTGEVLTADNAARSLLSDVYFAHPSPPEQDAFFASAASGVFDRLTSGPADMVGLIDAFVEAGSERRFLLWLADPVAQSLIADSTLSGRLPVSDSEATRVGLYFNEAGGTKMDFYLDRQISVGTGICRKDELRTIEVDVTLTNTVQDGQVLPDYVTASGMFGVAPGNIKTLVAIYAPEGSINQGVSEIASNGTRERLPVNQTTDSGYVVSQASIELAPGESRTIRYSLLLMASSSGNIEIVPTPGVNFPVTEQSSISC